MKSVNIKSMLLGAVMGACVIIATAATLGTQSTPTGIAAERYQLYKHQWWERGSNAQPRYNDAYLSGLFKIDTSNGQVWALTADHPSANRVTGWSLIK